MTVKLDLNDVSGMVFDCDGTLLDTLDAWRLAEAPLFAQIPFELTRAQEDEIHSAPIEEAARIFHETYGVMSSSEEVLAHLDDVLLSYYRDTVEPLPGAVELVGVANQRGIPCVVVSSSPRRYLEVGLEHVGIADCFIRLISTEDVCLSKINPAIYQIALDSLGSALDTTWAFDDAPYACEVMRAFGFKTVAPANDADQKEIEAKAQAADYVVATLKDLL